MTVLAPSIPNRRLQDSGTLRWVPGPGITPMIFYVSLGYVTANGEITEDDHPQEIFAKGTKAGSDLQTSIDVTCIMTSYALRGGKRMSEMVDALWLDGDGATCAIEAILKFAAKLEADPTLGNTKKPFEIMGR